MKSNSNPSQKLRRSGKLQRETPRRCEINLKLETEQVCCAIFTGKLISLWRHYARASPERFENADVLRNPQLIAD